MSTLPPHDGMSPDDLADAFDPMIGAGTPDTAPFEDVAVGWLHRQPVIAFALALLLPAAAAAGEALLTGQPWRAAAIAGAGAACAAGLTLVRRAVTPTAAPRLDKDTPLSAH